MRSAIYSLFTSLLLLVPISAVPLMAIFGVPQFTPVVASPLDDIDDEDWDRPARKPARAKTGKKRPAEDEFETLAEESLNWETPPQRRSPPMKKPRAVSRSEVFAESENSPPEFDEPAVDPRASRAKSMFGKSKPPAASDDDVVEFGEVVQVSNETVSEETPFAESEPNPDVATKALGPKEDIPRYRRKTSEVSPAAPDAKPLAKPKRPVASSETLTWTKAVERLNTLGIRNFKLEPGVQPGEFTFTCSYTPTNSPHVTRRFEAEADDPLKAVAHVLSQVERWAQQREAADDKRSADRLTSREYN